MAQTPPPPVFKYEIENLLATTEPEVTAAAAEVDLAAGFSPVLAFPGETQPVRVFKVDDKYRVQHQRLTDLVPAETLKTMRARYLLHRRADGQRSKESVPSEVGDFFKGMRR